MDAALTIGPRNTRRLTVSAISLGLIAAVATAGFLFLRPSDHSRSASSNGAPQAHAPTFVTQKLVFGMTETQVLHRIGEPTRRAGACWQYDENEKIRDGENVLNAERVCFLSGVYSYEYPEMDGKWFYPTTPLKIGS